MSFLCSKSCSIFGRLADDVPHRQEADARAVLGDRENRLLGFVEDDVRIVFGFLRALRDLLRREISDRSADFSLTMRA